LSLVPSLIFKQLLESSGSNFLNYFRLAFVITFCKYFQMENIKCAHDKIVSVDSLIANPRNPNKHPDRQIEMLAKIIAHQGQRSPVVVSNRSGFIVKGHGRLQAIISLGWPDIAVDYQDYDSEAQEFQDMVADNKIAELADHDNLFMIEGMRELELDDSDFDLLGLDGFNLDLYDKDNEIGDDSSEWVGMPDYENEDKTSFRSIIVHFKNSEDVEDFKKLVKDKITDKTKSIWFPEIEIESAADKVYT